MIPADDAYGKTDSQIDIVSCMAMLRELPAVRGAVYQIHSGKRDAGLPLCAAVPLWVPRAAIRIDGSRIEVRCPLVTLVRANSRNIGKPLSGLARTIRVLEGLEKERARAAVLLCAALKGYERHDEVVVAMGVAAQYAGFQSVRSIWPGRTRHALPDVDMRDVPACRPTRAAVRVLRVLKEFAPIMVQPIEARLPSSITLSQFRVAFPDRADDVVWVPRGIGAWQDVTTASLRGLVWSRPMSHLALEFGVSNTAIKKACLRRGITLPPLGYWRFVDRSEVRVVEEPVIL